MFSLDVIDTDAFLDMSASAQSLYFHLALQADDDGFVGNPRKIMRSVNAAQDDLKIICAKGFIIGFDSGVCVIRDWHLHNSVPKNAYRETVYLDEKRELCMVDNHYALRIDYPDKPALPPGRFVLNEKFAPKTTRTKKCQPNVDINSTQDRIGKDRIGKDRVGEDRVGIAGDCKGADKPPRHTKFVPPSVEEVQAYITERGCKVDAERFVDFYTANGWMVGKTKMKDWKASVRYWERNEKKFSAVTTSKRGVFTYEEGGDIFGE